MPGLKEKLNEIERLRKLRDEADEKLYKTKLELFALKRATVKSKNSEINYSSDNLKQISELRAKIAELEAELNSINISLSETDVLTGRISEKESFIKYLKDKIEVIEAKISSINLQIEVLSQVTPPNERKIRDASAEKEQLHGLLGELQQSLSKAEDEIKSLQRQRVEVIKGRQSLINRKNEILAELERLKSQLADATSQTPGGEDLADKQKKLNREYEDSKKKYNDKCSELSDLIKTIYIKQHPRDLIGELDDTIPFLLFPLRIETRFITDRPQKELWIRVYPDDIAVHTHEKILTDSEINAGELYWLRFLSAELSPSEAENIKKDAWSKLASVYTPQRSAWIAKETFPSNWSDILSQYLDKTLIFVLNDINPDIADEITEQLKTEEDRERF
jgi:myosin heavy subunit